GGRLLYAAATRQAGTARQAGTTSGSWRTHTDIRPARTATGRRHLASPRSRYQAIAARRRRRTAAAQRRHPAWTRGRRSAAQAGTGTTSHPARRSEPWSGSHTGRLAGAKAAGSGTTGASAAGSDATGAGAAGSSATDAGAAGSRATSHLGTLGLVIPVFRVA